MKADFFKRNRKKILKISGIIVLSLLGLIILGIVAVYAFRQTILETVLSKVQRKMENSYQTRFIYKDAGFHGLTRVYITGIELQPENKARLLVLDSTELDIRLWSLIKGKVRLSSLVIGKGNIDLVKDSSGVNFSSFLKKDSNAVKSAQKTKTSIANTAYKLIRSILDQVPNEMLIDHFMIGFTEMGRGFSIGLRETSLKNEVLDAKIPITDSLEKQEWIAQGNFDPDDIETDISVFEKSGKPMIAPYALRRFGLKTGCDSVRLQVKEVSYDDELLLKGYASAHNFVVNHKRLSDQDVKFENMGFGYQFRLNENSIILDSASEVTFNKISFNPFISYTKEDSAKFSLHIHTPEWQAQDFFNSLPTGIFSNLEGIQTQGTISYHLDFDVDYAKLDALTFDSDLRKSNFRILKYGKANLAKLNSSFPHTPYEYGHAMRTIIVGPENPNFTPLDQIPANLKNCVLINEDPSFFYHRGFIEEAFRQSIVVNLRHGRFLRGGSTISMQLVKNVFLSRQKTVARKMEEALIVWLIESNRLSTKERMFEVYLNIIEWAPNIYGISEASRFYFDKSPSELTLRESMFLAKLIPSPKAFRYRFNAQGQLKDYFGPAFKFMANRLVARGWLNPADTADLQPVIELRGPAKTYIVITDSTMTDPSLDEEMEEDEEKKWWQKIPDLFKKKK